MSKFESRRRQKNVTLTKEEENYLRDNYNTLDCKKISKNLGVSYGRIVNNAQIMGLSRPIKVESFDKNGFFDIDVFQKQYRW